MGDAWQAGDEEAPRQGSVLRSFVEELEDALRVVVPEVAPDHLMVVVDGSTLQMSSGDQSLVLQLPHSVTPEAARMREARQGTEVIIPRTCKEPGDASGDG